MNKYYLVLLVLGVIIFSAVFKTNNDFLYLVFWLIWFLYNQVKKIDGRYSVLAGLAVLICCPFFLISDNQLAQRLACWAFLLLFSGTLLLCRQRENE